MDCGADDFLHKPVDFPVLLDRVSEYLDARCAPQEPQQSETLYCRLIASTSIAYQNQPTALMVIRDLTGRHAGGIRGVDGREPKGG